MFDDWADKNQKAKVQTKTARKHTYGPKSKPRNLKFRLVTVVRTTILRLKLCQ